MSNELFAAINFAATGNLSISYYWDNLWDLYIDDTQYSFSNIGGSNFYYYAEAGKYYILYVKRSINSGHYCLKMSAVDDQGRVVQISYGLPILVNSAPFNSTIIVQVCGDWFKTGSEQWDDWNALNGDGCSSTWTIETGWTWSGVSNINSNKCIEIWGDGKRFNSNSTYWDDGNTIDGDGWSSLCIIDNSFEWSGGSSTSKDYWTKEIDKGILSFTKTKYSEFSNRANNIRCIWRYFYNFFALKYISAIRPLDYNESVSINYAVIAYQE